MAYKTRVPVRGAIILNLAMDKCLLVKGWKKGASWSFPRGKINKDEDDLVCAIREVREETGFDCEGFAKKEHFVDMTMRDQNLKLFIVPGIPEDTVFECQTRKEISVSSLPPNACAFFPQWFADLEQDIKWHKLSDLPTYNKNKNVPQNEVRTGKYYMVTPFLKGLRKWISTEGKKWVHDQRQQKLSSAANLIVAEETEVEEELVSPAIAGPTEPQGRLNIQPPVAANGYSSSMEHDEASIRLKNMLHFGPPKGQVDRSSAKLMNMLSGGVSGGSEINEHPNIAQLAPNPRALLSMLRTADGSGALNQAPEVNRPTPTHTPNHALPPHPASQTFFVPLQQGLEFFHQIPQSTDLQPMQQQQQQQQPQQNASVPLRNTGGIGAGAGWPQFPRGVPEHPPSPPPTSSLQAPPHIVPLYPQSGHFAPIPPLQKHASYPPPPDQPNSRPLGRNGFKILGYPQPTPQLPLTALETPALAPSKIPDLGQAGTLLSILKGATPVPAQGAHTPPPATPTRKPATPVLASAQTNLQKPPTPKGPRAQYQQQKKTTPPPTQSPSRLDTTRSPFRTSSVGYGPPKTKTPVQGLSFDRRESVSNEQQQTLLAMFRTGTPGQPTTGLNDEAVMSSPEQSPARPVRVRSMSGGSGNRSGSHARRAKGTETPRSPLGKERERESLMKYLEGVANGAGQ